MTFVEFITSFWGILTVSVLGGIIFILLSFLLYRVFFKRLYDILFSFILLVILLPLLLFLIVVGSIAMRGNPFFVQKRPWKKERIFSLLKFRTMNNRKDADGNLLPDSERLTKYGKFLRATSLDELPQLLNIFCGKLSFIGPRPLLVQYLPLYSEEQRKRHRVRPGMSGLAQVKGRNAISWEQKFSFDVQYVEKLSFGLDIKIFFMTIGRIFKRSGVSAKGEATMGEFTGNIEQLEVEQQIVEQHQEVEEKMLKQVEQQAKELD